MATQVGVTAVCMTAVSILAVENIRKSHDPFPQLMVGGIFTAGCAFISEMNMGLAMGIAVTFLTSTLVLHSDGIISVLNGLAGSASASNLAPNSTPYNHGTTPSVYRKA